MDWAGLGWAACTELHHYKYVCKCIMYNGHCTAHYSQTTIAIELADGSLCSAGHRGSQVITYYVSITLTNG